MDKSSYRDAWTHLKMATAPLARFNAITMRFLWPKFAKQSILFIDRPNPSPSQPTCTAIIPGVPKKTKNTPKTHILFLAGIKLLISDQCGPIFSKPFSLHIVSLMHIERSRFRRCKQSGPHQTFTMPEDTPDIDTFLYQDYLQIKSG